jgi:hypothetical protein
MPLRSSLAHLDLIDPVEPYWVYQLCIEQGLAQPGQCTDFRHDLTCKLDPITVKDLSHIHPYALLQRPELYRLDFPSDMPGEPDLERLHA